MPTEFVTSLITSVLGILVGAVANYFFTRKRVDAEIEKIKAEAEKAKAEASKLRAETILHPQQGNGITTNKLFDAGFRHSDRENALESFLKYAKEVVFSDADINTNNRFNSTINIVFSSGRGIFGYVDREPRQIHVQWRDLVTRYPRRFHILMTHPAFAHLREPAEERSLGDIELEILETTIYLHCVAGMTSSQLRLYRGSPTTFAIQARDHVLLNPYPYGTTAMDCVCFELEENDRNKDITKFMDMHFNHTWCFIDQPSKSVDGKQLVTGIDSFEDILLAFSECAFRENQMRLRLTKAQVEELDSFTCKYLERFLNIQEIGQFVIKPPRNNPFESYAEKNKFLFCDDYSSVVSE